MSQESTSEVTDFLLRIKELDQKTSREDELRAKKLEQDILDGKRRRQALREKARSPIKTALEPSISPPKTSSQSAGSDIPTPTNAPRQRVISKKEMEIRDQIDRLVGPERTLSISLSNISLDDRQSDTSKSTHSDTSTTKPPISTESNRVHRHANSMEIDRKQLDVISPKITPSRPPFSSTSPRTAPQLAEHHSPFQSPLTRQTSLAPRSPSPTKLSRSPTRGGSFIKSALLKRENKQRDDLSSSQSPNWKSPPHASPLYDSPPLSRSSESFGLTKSGSQWSAGRTDDSRNYDTRSNDIDTPSRTDNHTNINDHFLRQTRQLAESLVKQENLKPEFIKNEPEISREKTELKRPSSFNGRNDEKSLDTAFTSPVNQETDSTKDDELFHRGRPGSSMKWVPEKKKTWLESALTRKATDAKSRSPSPTKSFAGSNRPRSVVLPGAGGIYSSLSPMVSIAGRNSGTENTRNTLSYAGISSPRSKESDSPVFSNYADFSPERSTERNRSPLRTNTTGNDLTRLNSHSRTQSDMTGFSARENLAVKSFSSVTESPVFHKLAPTRASIDRPPSPSKVETDTEDLSPALLGRATLKSVPPKPSRDSKPTTEAIDQLRRLRSTSPIKSPARDELREALDNVRGNLRRGGVERSQPRDELKDALGSVKGNLRKSNTIKYQAPDELKDAVLSTRGSLRKSPTRTPDTPTANDIALRRAVPTRSSFKSAVDGSSSFESRLDAILIRGSPMLERSNSDTLLQTIDKRISEPVKRASTFESTRPNLNHLTKGRAKGPRRRLPTDQRKDIPSPTRERTSALGESQTINIPKNNNAGNKKSPPKPRKPSSSVRTVNV